LLLSINTNIDKSMRLCLVVFLTVALLSSMDVCPQGKNAKKDAPAKSQTTFKVPVNVVVINATATDKKGNPVTDLTSKDFRVYDDGNLQTIQTFAMESYGPAE
jgi:hypothetical protein